MLRIATLADARFQGQAMNLAASLEHSPDDYRLTLYCDDETLFRHFRGPRCKVAELPEIKTLGPKRAKLTAFAAALREGGTIWLDADAIVLESLEGMWGGNEILGCADELEYCPFIADRTRPWPLAPELENRRFINSGGFFAPASLYPFFEQLRLASLDETTWKKYAWAVLDEEVCRRFHFDGSMDDNHFFCAFLNLCRDVPVRLLDPKTYGWRGFLKDGQAQVRREGPRLLNRETGEPLKLVLFAGVRQTPELLRSLPLEISTLIFERIAAAAPPGLGGAVARVYAALSPALAGSVDPGRSKALQCLLAELPRLGDSPAGRSAGASYFLDPEAVKGAAFAVPPRDHTWNGLRCGGAAPEGDEYRAIRHIVRTLGIRTVLETDADELMALFRSLGLASSKGGAADLAFTAMPQGADALGRLVEGGVRPSFVLCHDALRDSAGIFRNQLRHGWRLAAWVESSRGLALLEAPPFGPVPPRIDDAFEAGAVVRQPRVRLAPAGPDPPAVFPGRPSAVRIALKNLSETTLSSRYAHPVLAAYHWLDAGGRMLVRDGARTALPFDLEPGDTAEFPIDVVGPENQEARLLQLAVVQEHVCWFEQADPESVCTLPIRLLP